MHELTPSHLGLEIRQPSRAISAPALLAVLCVLSALPPAAYATTPDAPALAHAQRARNDDPRSEPEREPRQIRTLSRALAQGLDSIIRSGGGSAALLMSTPAIAIEEGRSCESVLSNDLRPPLRPMLEREIDLPPPAMIA